MKKNERVGYMSEEVEDSFKMFIKEVSRIPLLAPAAAIDLAVRAKAGDLNAMNRLIEANIRLVISEAKKYRNCGLELEDLVQFGIEGLRKGLERYDSTKVYAISTYVTSWIRKALIEAVTNYGRMVRLPSNVAAKVNKIKKEYDRLTAELGCEPDMETVAGSVGMDRDEAEYLMGLSVHASLDMPFGEDGDMVLGDTLEDKVSISAEQYVEDRERKEEAHRLLNHLSGREREVIEQRFGFNGEDGCTLEEIGKKYGVTRECVRRIEKVAMEKLRKAA